MLSGSEKKIKIEKIEDLELRIDVIGYKRLGEAIVILFRDRRHNKTLYSMAIDSYCLKQNKSERNWSDDILRKYKVKSLSTICWTHPHLDHSKGLLKLFRKYCWLSTKIIKPCYFDNVDSDIVSVNDEVTKKVVDAVFGLNAIKRNIVVSALVPHKGYIDADHFLIISGNSQSKEISLNLLTPVSSIVDDYYKNGRKLEDMNGISVSFILNIDDCYMMFGGDTINEHIDLIDRQYLKDCKFVKIPHHSSYTGQKMGDYVHEANLVTACTTTYKTSLPRDKVVDKYKEKCKYVFTTGYKETKDLKTYFGIVEYVYRFTNPEISLDVNLYGNAHQV